MTFYPRDVIRRSLRGIVSFISRTDDYYHFRYILHINDKGIRVEVEGRPNGVCITPTPEKFDNIKLYIQGNVWSA